MMRRRLYFILPDLACANRVADDLLLARIEDRHMHFLARRGLPLGKLHEAGVSHKSDLVHGAGFGGLFGAGVGLAIGFLLYYFQPVGIPLQMVAIVIGGVVGALFGSWTGSLKGASIPNSKLSKFGPEIERGHILLIVDVPTRRMEEIQQIVARRHPEAVAHGYEPTMPAFP